MRHGIITKWTASQMLRNHLLCRRRKHNKYVRRLKCKSEQRMFHGLNQNVSFCSGNAILVIRVSIFSISNYEGWWKRALW